MQNRYRKCVFKKQTRQGKQLIAIRATQKWAGLDSFTPFKTFYSMHISIIAFDLITAFSRKFVERISISCGFSERISKVNTFDLN
jgi:hypothetical protein